MNKTDKKIITLLMILIMVVTAFYPIAVYANEEPLDTIIEFGDSNLKNILIEQGIDLNNDGNITIEEMEKNNEYLYIYNVSSIKGIEYAKNIRALYFSSVNLDTLDLTPFKKLEYFSYNPTSTENINTVNIVGADHIFIYSESGWLFGNKVEKELTIYKNELYHLNNIAYVSTEDESIVEIDDDSIYYGGIIGKEIGTTNITYLSKYSNIEIPVKVVEPHIDADKPLENSNVISKVIENECILQSNGDLWNVYFNADSTADIAAKKIDEAVIDFEYVYSRNGKRIITLDSNNVLKVLTTERWKDKKGDDFTLNNTENVKEIFHCNTWSGRNEIGYLTNSNELYVYAYLTNPETNKEEYRIEKVAENVERTNGPYFISEGQVYKYEEIYQLYNEKYIRTFVVTESTQEEMDNFKITVSENNFEIDESYYIDENKNLYKKNGLLLMTNVEKIDLVRIGFRDSAIVIFRTDGTVWTESKTSEQRLNFIKIIGVDSQDIKFTDIPKESWYYDSVKYVSEAGIITGYNSETFGPFNNLTREQLVNILWRIEGRPDASDLENKFSDVPAETWYTDAIKWASANDIVKGHGGTSLFGVGENIIRQDLAIMLTNYAKYKSKYEEPEGTLNNFADKDAVSGYAVDAVRWASDKCIISGNANSDGTRTIAPLNNAMRCEAAVMLMRFCENILN